MKTVSVIVLLLYLSGLVCYQGWKIKSLEVINSRLTNNIESQELLTNSIKSILLNKLKEGP